MQPLKKIVLGKRELRAYTALGYKIVGRGVSRVGRHRWPHVLIKPPPGVDMEWDEIIVRALVYYHY